ncbi:MAG: DUF4395 domain-containing protein [Bacteroidota bacterium]
MEKDCPVDFVQVNENKVRLNALWVFILVVFTLFYPLIYVYVFLSIDFFLRAFNFGKYSLLNWQSQNTIEQLNIPNKPIDQAPKRFAAGIGFTLSLLIVALLFFHLQKAAFVFSLIFAVFTFLESFLGICAGCYVYTLLKQAKIIK